MLQFVPTREDDDYFMISGIQHFAFCPRQWALIHIEQQWRENVLTTEGQHVHQRVDLPDFHETRGELRIVRSVPIGSERLRIRGIADMVEFRKQQSHSRATVELLEREGYWLVQPVEYKRGKPKADDRDAVQLCAQAICLEEMLKVEISNGYIYYHEIRRRQDVAFTGTLRERVEAIIGMMRQYADRGQTPKAEYKRHCEQCSLLSICKPKWSTAGAKSATAYLTSFLGEVGRSCDDC